MVIGPSISRRFKRWSDCGMGKELFKSVQQDLDREYVSGDSTIVRAHACAAGLRKNSQEEKALGQSKDGFSPKIPALVDSLG